MAAHNAGIAGKNDYRVTTRAPLRRGRNRGGLLDNTEPAAGSVLTGAELAALSADQYPEGRGYSQRVCQGLSRQKLRLVQALQARGHVSSR